MRGLFSVAQTPQTSSLSHVPWSVAKFSKPPLPTNAKSGQDKDDDGQYEKSRKGTSWSLRLDNRKNNVITQNTVGCGELTAMVTD